VALNEHLETVADAEHWQTLARLLDDGLHYRSLRCDGAAAQVVAVGEAAWENNCVNIVKVGVGVPKGNRSGSG
jgi:hypothetical protein